MRRTKFENSRCAIARTVKLIGHPWSILIIACAMEGVTRFSDFQQRLEIAPNILAARLRVLVEGQILERRQSAVFRSRHEYALTQRGRDFQRVLESLAAWSRTITENEVASSAAELAVESIAGLFPLNRRSRPDEIFTMTVMKPQPANAPRRKCLDPDPFEAIPKTATESH